MRSILICLSGVLLLACGQGGGGTVADSGTYVQELCGCHDKGGIGCNLYECSTVENRESCGYEKVGAVNSSFGCWTCTPSEVKGEGVTCDGVRVRADAAHCYPGDVACGISGAMLRCDENGSWAIDHECPETEHCGNVGDGGMGCIY